MRRYLEVRLAGDAAVTVETTIKVVGLSALSALEEITPAISRAAYRAINKTVDRARAESKRRALDEVAFPASYLSPGQGRLTSRKASSKRLEGAVTGRTRATSLARFTKDKALKPGQSPREGVTVTVKTGVARFIEGAFLVRFKSGSLGLAVRSESPPRKAYKPKKLGKNLWLLYGPSVNQVLDSARNKGGIFTDIQEDTAVFLDREFLRLLDLEISRA